MKRIPSTRIAILAILLLSGIHSAKAADFTTTADVATWIYLAGGDTINPYASDGDFVNAPGLLTGAVLYIPGALITAPFCAIYEPFTQDGYSRICSHSLISSYWLFHTIGGFPFYVVKKTLWDVPAHFISLLISGEEAPAPDNTENVSEAPQPAQRADKFAVIYPCRMARAPIYPCCIARSGGKSRPTGWAKATP